MADDRTIKIKLSTYGDEAAVAPSLLGDDRILVGFFAANGMPEHPQVFTPAEWDAFVAAGNAALGRAPSPPPIHVETTVDGNTFEMRVSGVAASVPSTPLADVFAALATEREAEAKACWGTDGESYRGEAEAYREAARMVREQGPTVPRAVVAHVLDLHAQIAEESGEYRANLIDLLLSELDDVRALLAAPVPTGGPRP